MNIILTIALFNVLIVLFKLFPKYKVDNLQALIANYFVAASFSVYLLSTSKANVNLSSALYAPWIFHSIGVGILFILTFNWYVKSTQKVGVAISTVANKMSLVFPVLAAISLYPQDKITGVKVIGLLLAIAGVYFTSTKKGKFNLPKEHITLIFLIFLGQGLADILFADGQRRTSAAAPTELMFVVLFIVAGTTGLLIRAFSKAEKSKKFNLKSLLWGVMVGMFNYGTLYFMAKALTHSGLDQSEVFPVVSMGVVLSSALIGLYFFKEKLSAANWLGIFFAVLGIAVISFGNKFFNY